LDTRNIADEASEVTNTKTDPCAYCRGTQTDLAFSTVTQDGDRFDARSCKECLSVYLNPHPSSAQLDKAYAVEYYGSAERKFVGPVDGVLNLFRDARARRVSKLFKTPAKALDIGCGHGQFAESLLKRNFEVHGAERSEDSARRARSIPNLHVHVGELDASSFEDGSFDLVTLWHVYEHLSEPKKTLDFCRHVIRPGGYLVLSLPNIASWQARLFRGQWLHLDPPRHLFLIPPDALTKDVEALGFQLKSISYLSFEQNIFGYQQSLLNCLFPHRDVLFDALKGQKQKVKALSSSLSLLLQATITALTFPFFFSLCLLEAMFRAGGTMELVFEREAQSTN
jgi:2-polyprenyl-3-methyl-5-hydroxy-6-metoxy-1,4-benzoquinol methylase